MTLSLKFPTTEALASMSLKQLREIDITSVDEEKIVQKEINVRLASMPLENPTKPESLKVPDIKTPEEEAKWQKKLDEENAKRRKNVLQSTEEKIKEEIKEIDKVSCEICKKEFKNEVGLRLHLGKFHPKK